jgi:hypothetical protein
MNRRNLAISALSTLLLGGAFLISGCSESPMAPTGAVATHSPKSVQSAGVTDVSGQWYFEEHAVFVLYAYDGKASKSFRCSDQGVYDFVQNGSSFSGTYSQTGSCEAEDGTTLDLTFSGEVVNGVVSERQVTFATADGCLLEGAVSGPALDVMQGAGRCGGGHVFGTYRPRWTARR